MALCYCGPSWLIGKKQVCEASGGVNVGQPGENCGWPFQYLTGLTPSASLMAQIVKRLPAMRETRFNPWVGKIPWRRKWQPTPVLLPGKSHGQRSLVGYSPWDRKESDMTERLHIIMVTPSVWSPRSTRRIACHPHWQNQTAFQVTQR